MKHFLIFLLLFFSISIDAVLPQKVIICGVCRDVESRVPYSMRIMEKIGRLFSDYRIIVYENNSKDKTPELLRQWVQNNKKVHAMSEKLSRKDLEKNCINRLSDGEFFRPELIACARNRVLARAFLPEYQDFEYLIWMDMDFKVEPAYQGFIEVFESNKEWDAVFAFGVCPNKIYWDWYALRDKQIPLGSELLGNYWWYLPKKLKLTLASDWYPVYSAFGGCGIYKKKSIEGCWYSGLVTKDLGDFYVSLLEQQEASHVLTKKYVQEKAKYIVGISSDLCNLVDLSNPEIGIKIENNNPEKIIWRMSSFVYKYPSVCEHVPFHASMIMKGHDKLFINPRLLFHYGG